MWTQAEEETLAIVGLGANIAPEQNIAAALRLINARVRIQAVSTFYRTAPIGRPQQPAYINGVIAARTVETPRTLKFEVLREIERQLGRVRTADKFAPRPIDLDLLLYGDRVLDEPDLRLPDPDLFTRDFLSAGVREIAPQLMPKARPPRHLPDQSAHEMTPLPAFTQRMKEMLQL